MESMLFGAFTVLFTIAIWILLYREKVRGRSTTNRVLCATSTAMWLLSVAVCYFSAYAEATPQR